jgi:cystine transport system permease protein
VEALSGLASLLLQALPELLRGTAYTLLFALASMVLGLMLGALIAVARIARVPVLARAAVLYVSCMRGTPLLVQVFVIYYGLPSIGIRFDPITAGILALTLNVAAYLSESMRGAINAIRAASGTRASASGSTAARRCATSSGPRRCAWRCRASATASSASSRTRRSCR